MQLLKEGGVTKDNRNTKENENPSAIRVIVHIKKWILSP